MYCFRQTNSVDHKQKLTKMKKKGGKSREIKKDNCTKGVTKQN